MADDKDSTDADKLRKELVEQLSQPLTRAQTRIIKEKIKLLDQLDK